MMPDPERDQPIGLRLVEDQFILEWGRMSTSWGINRTMAQIQALLLITGRPFCMDEIVERLRISRGNASMNLRDLVDWGVIRRFRPTGARKDLYVSDQDVWQMFTSVIRERKRREIDPTVEAIKGCLALVPNQDSEAARAVRDRLSDLLEFFAVIDQLYQSVFGPGSLLSRHQATREDEEAGPLG